MVEDIGYLGDMSVYQVLLDSGKRVRVTQTNTVRGNPDAITWDEQVYVTWGDNCRLGADGMSSDRHGSPAAAAAAAWTGRRASAGCATSAFPAGRWSSPRRPSG